MKTNDRERFADKISVAEVGRSMERVQQEMADKLRIMEERAANHLNTIPRPITGDLHEVRKLRRALQRIVGMHTCAEIQNKLSEQMAGIAEDALSGK